MSQLPSVPSPLDMPSFSALTPHYAEAVLYRRRDFLGAVNVHGVSPLVYLKALHGAEWANFLERLGVANETEVRVRRGSENPCLMRRCYSPISHHHFYLFLALPHPQAWAATTDAQGAAISGEVEVRLWASHRGQTLGRTVHGLMEGVRAVRLLATLQLEQEYTALEEVAKPPGCGLPRLTADEIERDAALAGQWFAGERFQYVLACQRYFDHGEGESCRAVARQWRRAVAVTGAGQA
jgi:callose synthase